MPELPQNGPITVPQTATIQCALRTSRADLRNGEIRKAGSRIKLQEQPFKVLQILLEKPWKPRVARRGNLQSRIWPEGELWGL